MMQLSARDRWLLLALTLFWGLNWPVMKLAVRDMPPLAFRGLCLLLGVVFLAAVLRLRGQSLGLPRQHWRTVVQLAVPNMVIWHLCAIVAVRELSSGRAAILGYTMPIWVAVISVLVLKERPTLRLLIGLLAALVGTLLLLSSEWRTLAGKPEYVGLMLIAAMAWGAGTVMMRRSPPSIPLALNLLWMMIVATLCVGVASWFLESEQWRLPTSTAWWAILYNAIIIFAFCHLVWFYLAKNLPPMASSLSIMMIPVLGVLSGAWFLGERPYAEDWIALVLELVALGSVLVPHRAPVPSNSSTQTNTNTTEQSHG